MNGRPTAKIELREDERETFERWAWGRGRHLALRHRIVLVAVEGRYNHDIAAELGCHAATVGKRRSQFPLRCLNALLR